MIDWDLAISTGTRWARPGPQVSLTEARRTVAELRDLAGAVQQPVYQVTGMSAAQDGSIGPGRGGGPARLDQGERGRLPGRPRAAGRTAQGTKPGRRVPVSSRRGDQRGGLPGDRDPGRADPGLPVRPGARPVRAVPPARGLPDRWPAAGPAHPGRAEHRHDRARTRRRPARFPPLGLPARGDAPAAVHRRAVAARLRAGADDRVPAGLGTGPGGHPAAAARARPTRWPERSAAATAAA